MDAIEFIGGCIIVGIILLMGISIYDSFNYDVETTTTDLLLHNLNDGSQVTGRFSLGSGYINEKPCFVFYQMEGDGYVLKTVRADLSKIIEDENDKPYIRTFNERAIGKISKLVVGSGVRYEFHVPKGTIVEKWSLDAEL